MISPQKIGWNKYLSTTLPFDITTCLSFDGDSGDIETHLSREAVVSETYNGALKRGSSYKWSESMSPTLTFVKADFSDFSMDENRKMLTWLTSKQTPGFLDIYTDDSDAIAYSILGNFISISQYKLGNSRVVGYIAQFESLMPWALSPLHEISKSINASDTLTFDVETDEPKSPIYPRITIEKNGSGDVIITNTYADEDDQSIVATLNVKNNGDGERIVVDGANRVISSSHTNRIFGDDFVGWSWLPLYNGTNTIVVTGNCTVNFEWREPRKIGEL